VRAKKETSLTESVYRQLRTDVVMCRLQPGAQLKTAELAQRSGVSLASVREALARLTAEGLVEAEPQRGFRAAAISAERLQDLTAVRIDIETMCLRQSVVRFDLLDDVRLDEAMSAILTTAETDAAVGSHVITEEWSRAHSEFHEALVAACPSQVLLNIRRQLFAQSERYRCLSVPLGSGKRDIERDHRPLVESVKARDAERACQLLSEHILQTTQILLSARIGGKAAVPRD